MSTPPALGRRGEGWVVAQALLILAVAAACLTQRAWSSPWTSAAGGVLLAFGAFMVGWSAVALGDALTPFPAPKPGQGIVARGPYACVRHPIYSGVILLAAGGSLLQGSWLALALTAVLAAFFELKSRREEAWLAEREGYAAYRARVRGRLVPRSAGRRSRS